MAGKRNDDLEGYVRDLKSEAYEKHKPYQRWVGEAVVPLQPGQDPNELARFFETPWTVSVSNYQIGVYAWLFLSYTVHGANANDAEKKISEVFRVSKEDIKIRTTRVEKIDQ